MKNNQTPLLHRLLRFLGINGGCVLAEPTEYVLDEDASPKRPDPPEWAVKWNDLVKETQRGKEFDYMGVTMKIVNMSTAQYYDSSYLVDWVPGELHCDYVDKSGRIQDRTFSAIYALKILPNA